MDVPRVVSDNGIAITIFTGFMALFAWLIRLFAGKVFSTFEAQIKDLKEELATVKNEMNKRIETLEGKHDKNEELIVKLQGSDRKDLMDAINRSTGVIGKCLEAIEKSTEVMTKQGDYLKILYDRLISSKGHGSSK